MNIRYMDGVTLSLGGINILFDSARSLSRGIRLVSHAHADHSPARYSEKAVMTPETHELVSSVRSNVKNLLLRRINESLEMDDLRIILLNAGHVLGSSQFLIESNHGTLLYTGDINTYETIISEPAQPVDSDILIIESTYGDPSFIFPDREVIYSRILKWVMECVRWGEIPALKVYSIGKSQEILKLINTATSLQPVTGPVVTKASQAYSKLGVKLDFIPAYSEEGMEVLRTGDTVYVDSVRRDLPTRRKVRWALATGWALKYRFRKYDIAFPLSSHADFKGLVEYTQQINPKKVYVIHGYTHTLARYLSKKGIDATALDELTAQQRLIFE